MTTRTKFGAFDFELILPDSQGGIPYKVLRNENPNSRFTTGVFALEKSRSYRPGAHNYAVSVKIVFGRGRFFLADQTCTYEAGSEFPVPAFAKHAFVEVTEDTVFTKRWPSMLPKVLAALR